MVIACLSGLKGKTETAVGPQGLLLRKHLAAVTGNGHTHAGAAQAVPGIAFHHALHRHGAAYKIQLFGLFKLNIEGREHEFVHTESIRGQVFHFQREVSAPEAPRNHKLPGSGAKISGLQGKRFQKLSLGILQAYGKGFPPAHPEAIGGRAFIHHGLEAERIAGRIGPAVLVKMAENAALLLVNHVFTADSQALAAALPAHGFQLVIRRTVHSLLKRGRQPGKALQPEGRRGRLHILLEQAESHFLQGLPALVIGHIHAAPARFLPESQGEGVLAVCLLRRQLPAHSFQGIASVRQYRQVQRHGIPQVIAARQIGHLPGPEGFLPFPEAELGVIEVLEKDFYLRRIHFQAKVLRFQHIQKALCLRAGLGQDGFVAFEGLAAHFKAAAGGSQGFIRGRRRLGLVQLLHGHGQQLGLREQGQGLPFVLVPKGGERFLFIGPLQAYILQDTGGRVSACQHFFQAVIVGHGPEDILCVGSHKGLQGATQVMVHAPVQRRMVPVKAVRMRMDIGLKRLGRCPVPFFHPEEGDQREIEAVHVGLEAPEQLRTLFPIPALDGIDILHRRIVEVHGQFPANRFRLDFQQYLRLFHRTVGLAGLLVLKPQLRKLMTVRHSGKVDDAGQGGQQSGYQKTSHKRGSFQ